jgi:acyl carrier protein
MTISSRTPEGLPNRCPVCGNAVCIEPSAPLGDAPCPACGTLLWFLQTDAGLRLVDPEVSAFVDRVADRLGISSQEVRGRRLDELVLNSLDVAELVMELEEGRK